MAPLRWLPALALLLLCAIPADMVLGIRIYRSRRKAMSMLSGISTESQQYFSTCEQSSNAEACELAFDNDFNQEFSQCASTNQQESGKPWWRGYLENPIYATSVYIQNSDWKSMGDVDGLLDFGIVGNGHTCFTHASPTSFESKTFPCDILTTDISIMSNVEGAVLSLCEVQVFGAQLKFPTLFGGQALPLKYDNCEQSTVDGFSNCWLAQDRYFSGDAKKGVCAMTLARDRQWWLGKLEKPALVQVIVLTNRVDCCKEELNNFDILISSQLCHRYSGKPFEDSRFFCNEFGDEVKIQMLGNGRLTLCEVQVIGHLLDMTSDSKREPVGCYKDDPLDPEMPDFNGGGPVSITNMHSAKCDRICRRLDTKYFALQNGFECWCGNKIGKHPQVNQTECYTRCEGKQMDYCGGKLRNLVYKILKPE